METTKVLLAPVYEVNPLTICKDPFFQKRKVFIEEVWREWILDALDSIQKNPEKYNKPFKIRRVLRLSNMNAAEMELFCKETMNGRFATHIESALEKAQRIVNGEGWSQVCNHPETAGWDSIIIE
ncbi:MAG: hypothetical protein HFJ28_03100 [Clostridia bacterium]|jgi:hypothetical protein|nr:hypothetical protein [Clostridia bacterium]